MVLGSPLLAVCFVVMTALITLLMPAPSSAADLTIKVTSMVLCPDDDGSNVASPDAAQYATVAALKASGTYAAQINSGPNSLGCKVAGVDYHVGLSTSQTLKDPTLGGLPSGCSYASNKVTCSGGNVTYKGWDHTLHNGIRFEISGNNNTITQNKLGGGGSNCPDPPVSFVAVGGTTTFTYNTVIGNAGACGAPTYGGSLYGTVANGGTLLVEWNYIQNSTEDMVAIGGPTGAGNAVFTEKYNLLENAGWAGHPDGIQFCGGNFNSITINHNTFRQGSGPTQGVQPFHIEAQCTAALSNTVIAYNTIVTPIASSANFDIACKQDSGSNTNTNFAAYGNYIDASGAIAALSNSYGCPSATFLRQSAGQLPHGHRKGLQRGDVQLNTNDRRDGNAVIGTALIQERSPR